MSSFLKKVVKTAGRGLQGAGKYTGTTTVMHLAARGVKEVAEEAEKVPMFGKPLSALVRISIGGPFQLTEDILKGARIDRAVLKELKQQVRDVKEVGPYAQMVFSMVPGVGSTIAGGIGAGLALANGQPIDKAVLAACRGAIPGGTAAQMAFDMSVAIAQKKPLDTVLISALPIPEEQKKAVTIALATTKDLLAGKKIDKVLMERISEQVPKELRPALAIGVAVGHGQSLQKAAIQNLTPVVLEKLQVNGAAILKVNPTLKAGLDTLKDAHSKAGFEVGAALSRFQLEPIEAVAVRKKLSGLQKKGFDLALSAHIGGVEKKAPKADAAAQFAFRATIGAQNLSPGNQTTLLNTLAAQPKTRVGVTLAAKVKTVNPTNEGFWKKVLRKLGLLK